MRAVTSAVLTLAAVVTSEYILPPLPFKENALEPFISALTISTHYNKHHAGYVKKLNKQREENKIIADKSILDIIEKAADFPTAIVNNAAQIYNHEFYWNCIAPMDDANAQKDIDQKLFDAIARAFDGFDNFKQEFTTKAKKHFGSGWLWLVVANGQLKIAEGHDAQNPISFGEVPLVTIDIWEHAYYLDYKNERGRYVDEYFERINWKFVAEQFENAFATKTEL